MIVNPSREFAQKKKTLLNNVDSKEEETLDQTLRPKQWGDFIGQERIKKNIQIILQAAQERKEAVDHLLFCGGPGLGKSTLSRLVAKSIGSNIRIITGPAIQRPGDLAAILTSLSERDVLFVDEIHRLNKTCEEIIYPAMEDFKLHIITGTGPMARTLEIDLPPFTLIGATTRVGLLTSPLRDRFGATFQVEFYSEDDVQKIIKRSANILCLEIDDEAIMLISQCSRFTPRIANRLLKRIRDFAQVEGMKRINKEITELGLSALEIDKMGLEPQDRKILEILIRKFDGGPVGLQALAASTNEEQDNILAVYEPYLLQLGLIIRSPKGRIATQKAYEHLGINPKSKIQNTKLL
ncbi:Holliday junction branch migration DNA helicase RuvB [Patescibacteria group bacterium]|nr:Holliday junction branch migration DNA helicase RuvB [Patescibacteria group bacterium]MBU4162038.1 Holliday junction branch migration DNA helicase RuvB [Patescibacteria group bacterium]